MSDLESRVTNLEETSYIARIDIDRLLGELTIKVDRADHDWHERGCSTRFEQIENMLYKIMKFLEENWGITNVDDLI